MDGARSRTAGVRALPATRVILCQTSPGEWLGLTAPEERRHHPERRHGDSLRLLLPTGRLLQPGRIAPHRLSSAVTSRVDRRPDPLDHQTTEDHGDLGWCQLGPLLEPPGQHGEERADDELDADLMRDRLVVPDA